MKYIVVLVSLLLFVGCFPFSARAQGSTIALVQHTSKDAGTVASATLAFNSNNTAGNWIGVCVRAGHSGELFTVVDSRGNTYHRAVQFNVTVDTPNGNTLGIFYAENIASGPNTITVSATASATMRFAIVEYSGVASANSLEVSAMAQGNGVSPNSGNATTTLNGDLLLGAISTANSASYTAGTGFITLESVPAKPGTKLFVEQQIKAIAGPESAHATLAAADSWGAVLAGFKPGAGVVVVPNITSLSPSSGVVGTSVIITGTNFGTTVGTVAFNGTAGTPTSWTTTRVVVPVPAGATSGNVVLTDPGVPSNGVAFTVTTPDTTLPAVAITAPANNATVSGTATITASATDNVAVASVQFKVDNANSGAAVLSAPYSAALVTTALTNGNHILSAVAVDTSGNAATSAIVTVNVNNVGAAPSITTLNPTSGVVGASVTISGLNLGATQATSTVKFNGTTATPSTWSATSVVALVPSGATTGNVVVTVGNTASNGVNFTVQVPAPSIASLNPTSGLVGTSVTIAGANFGATQGTSAVNFNGIAASPTSWSTTSLVVPVPTGATTGNAVVTVGGAVSNGMSFTVTTPGPSITSLNPTSGLVGAAVTISGANFGSTQGASLVSFNGIGATPTSWTTGSIVVAVPAGATTGSIVVTVSGVASNGVSFNVTVPAPSITSLSPTSGLVGASVTITGVNFGATQGTSAVTFSGIAATPASWSATSVVVPVPAGATTGNVVVTAGSAASNGVSFTVLSTTVGIALVQRASKDAGVISSSSLAFNAANTAGNFIAVCVRASISGQSFTVRDSNGNAYRQGVQFNLTADAPTGDTLGIFYAENINGGANTIAVSDTILGTLRFTILEYSGIATANSLDVTVTGQGTGTSPNSATTVTTGNGELLLAAVMTPNPASFTAGFGFVIEASVPAEPNTKLIAEDRIQTSAGAVSAGALLGAPDIWGVLLAAFHPTSTGGGTPPGISSLNPASGAVGTSVTITGTNFGAAQGTSTVKFNGTATAPTNWSATSITAAVPASATSGNVVVTVGGVVSNGMSFTITVPAPSIISLNPTSGLAGASVTITGTNFGATQGTSTVKFNGTTATPSSWSSTSVVASVPAGASTGNVVMTVGGTASNGLAFSVVADTTPPAVNITTPANHASVAATITLTATATDPDSPVTFVQFLIDGLNVGAQQTIAPYSITFDTTTLPNGNHTLTAVAQDPSANQGTCPAIIITISNGTLSTIGPLKQSTVNSRYLVAPAGNAVFLSGSHTWNDFQDTNTNSSPAALDFNSYVAFLKSNGQNATILWHKDLPEYCGWNFSGSTWTMTPWPWLRPGPGVATDSKPKFDLAQFNQAYFDRLRARVLQLQQNGIYAIVQLFDGNQLTSARCSTDGYAFSGPNNINGVSDGYSSGAAGVSSVTMTANNAITNFQDAYVKKMVDTLNDLPTVIWEIAEEQPAASMTWWAPHVMGLVRAYETGGTFEVTTYPGKPLQHLVGIGSLNATAPNDGTLYSSTADWIAPTINSNFSNQFPSNVSANNRGKVVINDSDHSLGYKSFTNSDGSIQDQNLRGYLWENLTSGAEGVVFMDPYEIFWQGSPVRNTCLNPSNQVCTGGVDAKLNKLRASMGYLQSFANSNLNLLKMTPQNSLSSTSFCLADNSATGAEYVIYAPSGGTFTVNLSATARALNVTWFNPASGVSTAVAAITGGSTKSFTAPFSGDAVLYLVDAAGHN
jgi:hypothetical protein